MIRLLFKKYRWAIILAFALVIVENVTFIAEPYVFGVAIDDLHEANRIENEVDSSVTNSILEQSIDSLRDAIIDSLSRRDSVNDIDSSQSQLLDSHDADKSIGKTRHSFAGDYSERSTPIFYPTVFFQTQRVPRKPQTPRERQRRQRRDSLKVSLNKNIRTLERAFFESSVRHVLDDTTIPSILTEHVLQTLSTRDTINKLVRSGKLGGRNPEMRRDSLRRAFEKRPHQRRQVIGKRKSEPIAFVLPREIEPFIIPLIPWLMLFVLSSLVGGIRRVYDTKIYTRMFADLSSSVVSEQLKRGEDLSKIAGRSALAWQNIEFFQYNLPDFIEQIINVVGGVSALAIFDWRLAIVGGSLVILVVASSRLYMNRIARIQIQLNDMHEQEYNTFATKDPNAIRTYYTEISALEIRFSNIEASGYGILRGLLLIMFLATLYISLDLDRFTIGELYAIVAYLWTFVTASEYIPHLAEKWVDLKDVARRIQSDSKDETLAENEDEDGDEDEE